MPSIAPLQSGVGLGEFRQDCSAAARPRLFPSPCRSPSLQSGLRRRRRRTCLGSLPAFQGHHPDSSRPAPPAQGYHAETDGRSSADRRPSGAVSDGTPPHPHLPLQRQRGQVITAPRFSLFLHRSSSNSMVVHLS